MQTTLLAGTNNYPSNSGVQLGAQSFLSGFQMERFTAQYTLGGTPGTSPSTKAQVMVIDSDFSTGRWVDVPSSTLSAAGQFTAELFGAAFRVVATAGSGYVAAGAYVITEVYPTQSVQCDSHVHFAAR